MPFRIDRFARKAFYSAVHATEDVTDSLQRAVFKKKKHKKQPAKIKEDSDSVLEELVSWNAGRVCLVILGRAKCANAPFGVDLGDQAAAVALSFSGMFACLRCASRVLEVLT